MIRLWLALALILNVANAGADILRCRFELPSHPMTYVQFDNKTGITWIQSGAAQKWKRYDATQIVSNLPPYYKAGMTLYSEGKAILSFRLTNLAMLWNEPHLHYPYEAAWNDVPGGPKPHAARGVCWSENHQAQRIGR